MNDDLSRLVLQEQRLRFQAFGEDEAWALGCRLRAAAEARVLPVTIEIRHTDRCLFFTAMAGSSSDNSYWMSRKINVVQQFHQSSYRVGMRLAQKGTALGPEVGIDPMLYAAHGGAFPIHVTGTGIIGAVAVSGLPQRDDHNLVIEVLCQQLGVSHDEVKLADRA